MRGRLAAVRQRATDSRGFALTEMIVVLAILLIVLTALTQLFVSASTAEVDMSKRVQAQQNARLALDKLRREIHCAKEVSWTHAVRPRRSPSRSAPTARRTPPAADDATFTWCTTAGVPAAPALAALALQRQHAAREPGGKWADYLTTGAVFTNYTAPRRRPPRNAQRRPAGRPARPPIRSSGTRSRTTSSCETRSGDERRTHPSRGGSG